MDRKTYETIMSKAREALVKQYEADKPKRDAMGMPDQTFEDWLIFDRITSAMSGLFSQFLESLNPDKPKAPAA